ncbi:MAG: hypothetical protein M9934_14525 [Thermomicrobiales bacterium]|nr:hypothetical protein [Thermomicrobiales bacterium]MCO5228356.1 hypothetical protein [Thermomicrobiales bacterium]MCO5229480.1 hypothetical protein [Thermomicrobiales bacterium]
MVAIAEPRTEDRIELAPRSTYEVVTRERLEHMAHDLDEIKGRINSLFYLVIGSIIVEAVLRWMQ